MTKQNRAEEDVLRVQHALELKQRRDSLNPPFAELWQRYHRSLLSAISGMISSPEDCEEIVQDTFVYIYESLEKYDSKKGPVHSWLFWKVRNLAKNRVRKYYRRKQLIAKMIESGFYQHTQSSENQVEAKSRIPVALAGMKHPEFLKKLLNEGYTLIELAKILRVKPDALGKCVRKDKKRGKKHLLKVEGEEK